AKKAFALLYDALVTPLYGWKILAFIISLGLWILDLFIYPLPPATGTSPLFSHQLKESWS
ncbi:MAG: hypothetical protein WA865_10190, partial [Spirulinaceae cyanobacterium]